MKKLSPKYITITDKTVKVLDENGVEQNRIALQIVFSLEKEVELGDGKERKTLFFFLSEWRKALRDADAGAYLEALDEKFGDTPAKHQDAFNRISRACTWKIDLKEDGYPTIVGVELPDSIKASALEYKKKRDAEMSSFGI